MVAKIRWLVRTGALLVMLGFFLPTMMVSCKGLGGVTPSVEFSLADIASGTNGDILIYGILLGMLLTLIVSFISFVRQSLDRYIPLLESFGIFISLLILGVKIIQISSNLSQTGLEFQLRFGAILLATGYIAAITGVVIEFIAGSFNSRPAYNDERIRIQHNQAPPQSKPDQTPQPYPPPALAHLEVLSGNLSARFVQVTGTDFSIGRGSSNSLSISDKKVSRTHVRLRYAQGVWFFQDQDSTVGTYINGQRVQAGRLNTGDQLKIGDSVFIFRS